MDLSKLRAINEQKAHNAVVDQRHNELLLDNNKTQEVIVRSFSSLVKYLDGKVTKTEVVNQLKEIGTPDVQDVVKAVDSLHETLKTHENTDLTEVTDILKSVLEEAKQIPKELPTQEKLELKDYSSQLTSLETTIKNVEKAIKAQKLEVEAPVVNVPETVVNVEKPDLTPLETSIASSSKDVVKAVKGIKIPELNTDPVEKLLKKTNKLLEELPELMPSGGNGSGSAWIATNSSGIPVPIELDADGNLPISTTTSTYKLILDDSTPNITYVGKAALGSATSAAVWQIQKIDETTGMSITWADSAGFTQVWDNRVGLVYA